MGNRDPAESRHRPGCSPTRQATSSPFLALEGAAVRITSISTTAYDTAATIMYTMNQATGTAPTTIGAFALLQLARLASSNFPTIG